MPTTTKKVCSIIPVARPRINFKAVLKSCDKLVTITKIISGPGVNAKIPEARIKLKTSLTDNKRNYFSILSTCSPSNSHNGICFSSGIFINLNAMPSSVMRLASASTLRLKFSLIIISNIQ